MRTLLVDAALCFGFLAVAAVGLLTGVVAILVAFLSVVGEAEISLPAWLLLVAVSFACCVLGHLFMYWGE